MKEDPFAHREKARYAKPIASRELIIQTLEASKAPGGIMDLEKALKISSKPQKEALAKRVRAMIRDGQLMVNRKEQILLVGEMPIKKVRVEVRKNATALLLNMNNEEDDSPLLLNQQQVREVMHDDVVLVRVTKRIESGKRVAVLVDIVQRGVDSLVGCLNIEQGIPYLTPVNKLYRGSILVKKSGKKLKSGQYVSVKILQYPTRYKEMIVEVEKNLGDHHKAGFERLLAVRSFNLPDHFSQETLNQALSMQKQGVQWEKNQTLREDLRHIPFVTIDGEDARDFDDAVWVKASKAGHSLYVAIADVSHYVTEDSAIDEDAKQRATSVYLPGSVIPMLPEALSNDLCSLVPDQDRFVMVAKIEIDNQGHRKSLEVTKAVIRSHARLTYKQVTQMIEVQGEMPTWFQTPLSDMVSCYKNLLKRRQARGSIDFDFPETKILFNDQGKIDRIVQTERTVAHKLIEEFMLVANEMVAGLLSEEKLPGLFRVHKPPESKKVDVLIQALKKYPIQFEQKSDYQPKDFQLLLENIAKLGHHEGLDSVILSTMSQAYYDYKNGGHFGLAYKHYCHFTSPIRRYPDLVVHRVLTDYLTKSQIARTALKDLAKHCSRNERRADDASRYIANWLKCDYMQDKIGKCYHGTISGVKSFGVFVTLDEHFVDGMVHITQLKNDYYDLDAGGSQLIGRRTNRTYKLGQSIKIRVLKVDQVENLIDFAEVENK